MLGGKSCMTNLDDFKKYTGISCATLVLPLELTHFEDIGPQNPSPANFGISLMESIYGLLPGFKCPRHDSGYYLRKLLTKN